MRSAGLAPASSDWQSDILLLNDDRKRAARVARPAPHNDKKNKHRCQLAFAPAGYFTAVLSVFQAHLPAHDSNSHAKPLDWKARGEESDNTGLLASHRKIDSLDSYSVSCHRLHGY